MLPHHRSGNVSSWRTTVWVCLFHAGNGEEDAWATHALTGDDTLSMSEIGVEIPVVQFHEATDFDDAVADE